MNLPKQMRSKNICSFVLAVAVLLSACGAYAQVTGSGTAHTIPAWTGTTSLGNSVIMADGGMVAIGTSDMLARLTVEDTATGANGIFVEGDTNGVSTHSTTTTGPGNALFAEAESPMAVAIRGQMDATTGGTAIWGIASAPNGTAGLFLNTASGTILRGQVGSTSSPVDVFKIDGTGKGFFNGGTQTGGADFAESMAVAKEAARHEPGDLLAVDASGQRRLKLSAEPYSTLVAGIYSTKPGVLATPHQINELTSDEVPLAIVGIVPCKVSTENGPIQAGDLLVSSSTPGYAMRGTDRSRMLGAVVGKALERQREGKGVIQVLVTLQ